MAPAVAAALISSIPALLQAGIGTAQYIKGNRMNPQRPQHRIPESAQEALSNAEYMASQTKLPGAEGIESNIRESTATSIGDAARFADNPNAILGTIGTATANQNEMLQNLGIQGAQFFANNQGALRNQLGNMAQYEDMGNNWNLYSKFLEEMQRKQALVGAGLSNIMGGVKTGSNIAGTAYSTNNM